MSERIDDLLEKTSRTFALAIPILPAPTRREVGLAYLLFRVADTFEDAYAWPKERRLRSLEEFSSLLEAPDVGRARELASRWLDGPPTEHEGYRELLAELPLLMSELLDLEPKARAAICQETLRTARGMASFVEEAPPGENIFVRNVRELRLYCYTVAGIVGELLTELFLLAQPTLEASAGRLRGLAAAFGEALQLVNILKDAAVDSAETRSFLPPSVPRQEIL
ncbi:MAG: squalene/phytoene synthase family protein, partial [Acidobacteria bacterium]|nr:squalene/phytoene synthase family protein [Acidobacteriota bacterium]